MSYVRKKYPEKDLEYQRTKAGLSSRIASAQRGNSIRRGHPLPNYTSDEFKAWLYSQPNFKELYKEWVKSNYNVLFRPSADRIDDDLPYTLNNIELKTWRENHDKATEKQKRPVAKYSLDNDFIESFGSILEALDSVDKGESKGNVSNVSQACRGTRKTAYGFIWKYI